MPSTVYDIRLRYLLEDKASKGLDNIDRGAARAARSTGSLSGMLGTLGAIAAGGFGIRAAGKALIGFNSGVEDTKLQIAGMLALTKKTNLTDELKRADRVFANLQRRANTLPGTTAEYARFAGMITQPIMDAGLSMKDLEDLTVNSVVAAKSLREEAGVAARDIDQALRGQFRSTDPFAGKVLGSIGYKGEEGRSRYNALSATDRAQELKRALMQKQWGQLAAAQGQTFSGVLSTFQDTLEQTLGKIGLPLFKAITEELKRWNVWAQANSAKLDAWGKDIASALVDGFGYVKSVVSFLIDHKADLIAWAKVLLALKAGQMVGNLGSSLVGGAGGLGAPIKGVGGAMGAAGPVAAAAMIGWQIGRQLDEATGIGETLMKPVARLAGVWSDAAEEQDQKFKEIKKAMDHMAKRYQQEAQLGRNMKGAAATDAAARLRGATDVASDNANDLSDAMRRNTISNLNPLSNKGRNRKRYLFDMYTPGAMEAMGGLEGHRAALETKYKTAVSSTDALLAQAMNRLTEEQRRGIDVEQTTQAVMSAMIQQLSGVRQMGTVFGVPYGDPTKRALTADEVMAIVRSANDLDASGNPRGKIKTPGKVNVTIQRIEVKSDDPDRFAFGLVEAFDDIARNPSGAMAAIREG